MKVIRNLVFGICSLTLLFITLCSFLSVDAGHWYRPIGNHFFIYCLLALVLLALFVITTECLRKHPIGFPYCLTVSIFVIIYFGACVLFVAVRQLELSGDQLDVLRFTLESMRGEYGGIFKGSYISMFPYQLGLVAYQAVILRFVELFDSNVIYNLSAAANYLAITNCLMASLSELFGLLIFDNRRYAFIYMMISFVFIPGFIYCVFVYNDVPSLTFALASLYCFGLYRKTNRKFFLCLTSVLIAISVVIRMTAFIFVLAYFLILLFRFLFEDRKLLVLLCSLMMLVVPLLAAKVPVIYYEKASNYEEALGKYGYELDDGCPYLANIAMSFDVTNNYYGWYNGFNKHTQVDVCNFDSACTMEKSRELLSSSFATMTAEPSLAFDFISKKVISQWCAPDFGAFNETGYRADLVENQLKYLYNWGGINLLLNCFLKGLMIVVSGLAFVGYLKKRDRNIMDHTLEIIVTGGFLFSIIWEAKSRYNLPYVYLLIILACTELCRLKFRRGFDDDNR